MSVIEIKGLTKRYADYAAVESLDLRIESGEFLTLLGPSGCGKTTTLRMIAGFIEPDAGTISVDGKVISSAKHTVAPERRGMGMVFQNYALWPHKSVFDNVAYGLRMEKCPKPEILQRVSSMLDTVGLGQMGKRYPHELSGGQQQRVALARSLVTEPKIMLLDEPLSNLDAKLRDQMRLELQDIQERTGISFIYVTHDQSEAMSMSTRIAVMRRGELIQVAPPRDVYFAPADAEVADFMGHINFLPGIVSDTGSTSDEVTVSLPSSTALEARSGPGFAPLVGQAVTLAVRPEALNFVDASDHGTISGTVARTVIVGSFSYIFVDVGADDDAITVRVQIGNTRVFEHGQTVHLRADAGLVTAFPSNTPQAPLSTSLELNGARS